MDPFFVFVHIPKTGGTSVRIAAQSFFGAGRLLHDYGPGQALTSDLVREWVYERRDPDGFALQARAGGYRFLSGHFNVDRYQGAFDDAVFLTWLRDPGARVWSAYRHARRRHGVTDGFEAFAARPGRRDVQWRATGGRLDRFDFVGVLEHNAESYRCLNERYGLALTERRDNPAPADDGLERPGRAVRQRVAELNARDLVLHAAALERFATHRDGGGPRPAVA